MSLAGYLRETSCFLNQVHGIQASLSNRVAFSLGIRCPRLGVGRGTLMDKIVLLSNLPKSLA